MRTRIVPFGCALVLALAGCGGDGNDEASKPTTPKSTQPAPDPKVTAADKKAFAEAKKNPPTGSVTFTQRKGKTVAKVKSERVGRLFCKQLRADGSTLAVGDKLTIETPDGDLTCDLKKKR